MGESLKEVFQLILKIFQTHQDVQMQQSLMALFEAITLNNDKLVVLIPYHC